MVKTSISGVASALALLCCPQPAHADTAKAVLAEKGEAAFECATFAALMNDEKEYQRLFDIGYRSFVDFLKAFVAGDVTEAEYRKHLRLDISFHFKGPTIDFAVGRAYEYLQTLASERVLYEKTPSGGVDLGRRKDDFEKEEQEARNLYRSKNCSLIL